MATRAKTKILDEWEVFDDTYERFRIIKEGRGWLLQVKNIGTDEKWQDAAALWAAPHVYDRLVTLLEETRDRGK